MNHIVQRLHIQQQKNLQLQVISYWQTKHNRKMYKSNVLQLHYFDEVLDTSNNHLFLLLDPNILNLRRLDEELFFLLNQQSVNYSLTYGQAPP